MGLEERHALENEALARCHERERRDIERRKRFLMRTDKRKQQSLERALRKERRLKAAARLERERRAEWAKTMDNRAMQDFFDAPRDLGLWRLPVFREGELSETFNEEAGFKPNEDSGDDDEELTSDWDIGSDDGADDDGGDHRCRHRRGKGYGRRESSE